MNLDSKKQKIALAVPSFSGGGAERVMVTLANKFHEWGYPVDLIVGLDKGPYKNQLNPAINKVVLADKNAGRIARRWSAIKILWRYLKKTDAHVLMSTIRDFNVFIATVKFFSSVELTHIAREADTLDRLFFTKSLTNKIILKGMKFLYPKSPKVIANCKVTKSDLTEKLGLGDIAVHVIYNPLDLEGIREFSNMVAIRKKKKIIACGRLDVKKNFPDLIKALPLIQKKYPDITLDILGQGPEKENLQILIDDLGLANAVKLVGFVDNPYEHYAAASVFVQTSLWEGFGYVLAEAMACGTPVIAYDSKGAMREILADGKYGLLTPVGDLQALADAIVQQIENPTPIELLNEAVARFDVDKIAREYLTALGVK